MSAAGANVPDIVAPLEEILAEHSGHPVSHVSVPESKAGPEFGATVVLEGQGKSEVKTKPTGTARNSPNLLSFHAANLTGHLSVFCGSKWHT